MWTVGGASYNTMDHCLVVTYEAYFWSTPVIPPDAGGKHDWIEFLVLDVDVGLLRCLPTVEPLSVIICTIANCAGAVCVQV